MNDLQFLVNFAQLFGTSRHCDPHLDFFYNMKAGLQCNAAHNQGRVVNGSALVEQLGVWKVMLACQMPSDFTLASVAVNTFEFHNSEVGFRLPFKLCLQSARKHSIVACVKCLDKIPWNQVQQWMVYHRYLGIDHFFLFDRPGYFYNQSRPYVESGMMTYVPFPFVQPEFTVPYIYDQTHSLHYCLMLAQATSKWIIHFDPDEYLVPSVVVRPICHFSEFCAVSTLVQLLGPYNASCEVAVRTRIMITNSSFPHSDVVPDAFQLMTLKDHEHKYFARSQRTRSMWIHQIESYIPPCQISTLPPESMLIFHYAHSVRYRSSHFIASGAAAVLDTRARDIYYNAVANFNSSNLMLL